MVLRTDTANNYLVMSMLLNSSRTFSSCFLSVTCIHLELLTNTRYFLSRSKTYAISNGLSMRHHVQTGDL